MKQEDFVYSVESTKNFENVVVSVLKAIEQKGWAVFQIYDIQERLAAKDFEVGKMKIIEICSAKYAGKLLSKNKMISLCMPCKINVIEERGTVKIVTMKPSVMGALFDGVGSADFIDVERNLEEMVDLAR